MKQELNTIALVISIMIKEMDQRETKRCLINLQDQLPTLLCDSWLLSTL